MKRISHQNTSPFQPPVIIADASRNDLPESGIDVSLSESLASGILSSTPISSAFRQSNNTTTTNNSGNSDSFVSIESSGSSASFFSCKSDLTSSPESSSFGDYSSASSDKSSHSKFSWAFYQPLHFGLEFSRRWNGAKLDLSCLNVSNWFSSESPSPPATPTSTPDTVREVLSDFFLDFEEREPEGDPDTDGPPDVEASSIEASVSKPGNPFDEVKNATYDRLVYIGSKREGSRDLHRNRMKELEVRDFRDCVDTQLRDSDHNLRNECHASAPRGTKSLVIGAQAIRCDLNVDITSAKRREAETENTRVALGTKTKVNLQLAQAQDLHLGSEEPNRSSNTEWNYNNGVNETSMEDMTLSESFSRSIKRNAEILEKIGQIDSLVVQHLRYTKDFPPLI